MTGLFIFELGIKKNKEEVCFIYYRRFDDMQVIIVMIFGKCYNHIVANR
ncbi:MAG: hypothetical protein K2J90_08670 [Lachnospiraceae bacterium]|nr:hypothetical protein [Lachnospiraceae bacterium]